LKKALGRGLRQEYAFGSKPFSPDWVAGMFMLFCGDAFRRMGGFDEKYFLYYEDVDLCARIRLAGWRVAVCPTVTAIHDARRASHRSMRYFRWHLTSILRYFMSPVFFRAVMRRRAPDS
jgi:GT2 family glycosyltransferase